MTDKKISCAPGKLMLLGEHAVVYGFPCIVTPVNKKICVIVKKLENRNNQLPDSIFVKTAVVQFFKIFQITGSVSVSAVSRFPSIYGLGSSSAVTVAVLKALSELFNINLSQSELFKISLLVTRIVNPKASGFDLAAAVYEKALYYQKDRPVEILPERKLPLLVCYSGIKAKTPRLVARVAEFKKNNPQIANQLFLKISDLVNSARVAWEKSDWPKLGNLFNQNHALLKELGVSTVKLDLLQKTALANGAYGAKLSGAGGGDCLIALYKENQKAKLASELIKNGGKILDVL